MVEMNTQVLTNLDRMIGEIEHDEPEQVTARCRLTTPTTCAPPRNAAPSRPGTARCAALRRMDDAGAPVTLDGLAREAGVSRSWLYTQPDLRLNRAPSPPPSARLRTGHRPPERQRASDASLLRRLQAATERIRRLEHDNQQLRDALARALGTPQPPTSSATPPSATRRTANPRNSSARAEHRPSRPSLPTPSTTETSSSTP